MPNEQPVSERQFHDRQQNKQIDNDPNAIYADTLREEKVTNILSQINPDNLLADVEHRIRGERKNVYSGEWEKVSNETQVSESLVSNFISFLGCILNQNTSMSNFTQNEINNLMQVIIEWVSADLIVNAGNYGIEGQYTQYDRIAHIICTTCFAVFKRALHGQESRRIFHMLRVNETLNQAEKKGGIMKNLGFWK